MIVGDYDGILALTVDGECVVNGAWQVGLIGCPALVSSVDQQTSYACIDVLIEEEPHASRRHRLVPDHLDISSFKAGVGLKNLGDRRAAVEKPLNR